LYKRENLYHHFLYVYDSLPPITENRKWCRSCSNSRRSESLLSVAPEPELLDYLVTPEGRIAGYPSERRKPATAKRFLPVVAAEIDGTTSTTVTLYPK
jgi:hypothetical protein